jgi:hypothetical protein
MQNHQWTHDTFVKKPPVDDDADESINMGTPAFAQMARLLLEQQMNAS